MLLRDIKDIRNGRIVVQDSENDITFNGIPIFIENPKGSVRHWETEEGDTGKTKMFYPYGYIKKTEGTDGDEIDCFVGPDKEHARVFVIAHMLDGKYDEDKVMLGFSDKEHARDAFLAHYDNASHLGKITEMSFEDFKQVVKAHKKGTRITKDGTERVSEADLKLVANAIRAEVFLDRGAFGSDKVRVKLANGEIHRFKDNRSASDYLYSVLLKQTKDMK